MECLCYYQVSMLSLLSDDKIHSDWLLLNHIVSSISVAFITYPHTCAARSEVCVCVVSVIIIMV